MAHYPLVRTCVAVHASPRAAGIPRAFSAAAIPLRLVAPAARSFARTGIMSFVRALARAVCDRLPSSLAAAVIVWPVPPRTVSRALAAARAAFVRAEIMRRHDADREPIGVRHVRGDEVDPGLLKVK